MKYTHTRTAAIVRNPRDSHVGNLSLLLICKCTPHLYLGERGTIPGFPSGFHSEGDLFPPCLGGWEETETGGEIYEKPLFPLFPFFPAPPSALERWWWNKKRRRRQLKFLLHRGKRRPSSSAHTTSLLSLPLLPPPPLLSIPQRLLRKRWRKSGRKRERERERNAG